MRYRRLTWTLALLLLGAVAPAHAGDDQLSSPSDLQALVDDAYIYGYPLVLMDATRKSMTAVTTPGPQGAPVNRFFYARSLPNPSERWVVRPNLDTLYATAWVDLSGEPIVMHVPKVTGRFYLLQVLDGWTNVIAAPGTRTLNGADRDIALVGPRWHGTLPPGLDRVDAPTDLIWIIGRTEVKGAGDLDAARTVELQYTLQPLTAFARNDALPPAEAFDLEDKGEKPPIAVAQLDPVSYFRTLARLMRDNPPPATDQEALARFAKLGLRPGEPFDPSPEVARALAGVSSRARQRLTALSLRLGEAKGGWRTIPDDVGAFGSNYDERATVALVGLGANLAADAIYPNAHVDGRGRPLDGSHRYVLHFERGQAPPVAAFWSLTLYDDDGYLSDNPARRYALRDRDPLRYNGDGSLDLYVQRQPPTDAALRANWLPTPAGTFNLMLRLYMPKPTALSHEWSPPALQRIDEPRAAKR